MKNSLKLLLVSILLLPVSTLALSKQETVYSNLNGNGKVTNTVVTNHLSDESNTIDDYTELTDILNINGNEKFKLNGNSITWQTSGSDIFYRGNTNKLLPIGTKITYYLNNKKMNAKKMIGKKGSVKIVLEFTNNLSNQVNINGVNNTLYTPFVVTVGTMLNNNNTNINITNGKVVNTGSKNLIVGISSPGLYESIGIDKLKGLDKITITYDTKSFDLNTIYVVATPKLISNSDLNIFNKIDSLYSNVDELSENMNLIEDSIKKINNGSTELKNKLKDSISKLSINKDILTLDQITAIKSQTLEEVNSKFTNEYKQGIADTTWNEVRNNLNPNDQEVIKKVTESVGAAVVEYLTDANEYADYIKCETGKSKLAQGIAMSVEEQTSCGVILSDTVLPKIQKAATTSATNTAQSISSYVAENVSKSVAVSVAISSSNEVASTLSEELSKKVANEVASESIKTITNSLDILYNGVDRLDSGITEFSSGITKFNNNGIKQLSSYSNRIQNYSNKLEALTSLSKNYRGYASNNSDSTIFVSMILISK